MMRIHPLLTALLLCAAPAAAQDAVLRPGSAQVDGQRIPERTDDFELYDLVQGGEPMGTLTLRTRFGTVDGREVIVRREVTVVDDELVESDSFSVERRTLAPLFVRTTNESQTVRLYFAAAAVRMEAEGAFGTETMNVDVAGPVFAGGTTDLLLGALPLAAGYTARASVFLWEEEEAFTIRIRVEGEEEVSISGGGRVAAWRVEVGGHPAMAGTYWMDRESHTLVQYESADGEVRAVRSRGARSRAREAR
jgi:hypothetical protein